MRCDDCYQDPCRCQRQLVAVNSWVFQPCQTDGCTTMIRSRAGAQLAVPICKWCTQEDRPEEKPELDALIKKIGKKF